MITCAWILEKNRGSHFMKVLANTSMGLGDEYTLSDEICNKTGFTSLYNTLNGIYLRYINENNDKLIFLV